MRAREKNAKQLPQLIANFTKSYAKDIGINPEEKIGGNCKTMRPFEVFFGCLSRKTLLPPEKNLKRPLIAVIS
jgi:hypothetical protein